MGKRIYLSSPHMSEQKYEEKFVQEAFDANWITSAGENINQFEIEMKKYTSAENTVALSSGTAAIHLALKSLKIQKEDIVFCSTLTFAASANPIIYEHATPVFIDSEEDTWNMCPKALEKAFQKYTDVKAVILVHLYGVPAKMDEIISICNKYNVPIIEDAAESLGATYKGQHTGTFGEFGIYSFNGNKIITTSGGGMLIGKNKEKIDYAKFLSTQAKEPARHYEHNVYGYNYRMSNILAGIGRGQLKVLEERIQKKTEIYNLYKNELEKINGIKMQEHEECAKVNNWLSCMTIDKSLNVTPIKIIEELEKEDIEARPVWKPMHLQPVFKDYDFITIKSEKSVAEDLFDRGVCLTSDTHMTIEEQQKIINIIKNLFNSKG